MKKRPKKKREQRRRKPLLKPKSPKQVGSANQVSQTVLDRTNAQERAMDERMSSVALVDFIRMVPVINDGPLQADGASLDEILEEYDERAPPEVTEQPPPDIAGKGG